jgi:hypothetical protein
MMKAQTKVEQMNQGIHDYGQTEVLPDQPTTPCPADSQMLILLTTPKQAMAQFDGSYIYLRLGATIQLNTPLFTSAELEGDDPCRDMCLENQFFFLGVRSANQLLRSYQLFFGNTPIANSLQNFATIEGVYYFASECVEMTTSRRYCFSMFHDVQVMNESVAGTYIPLSTFIIPGTPRTASLTANIEFVAILHLTQILELSGFKDYPTRVFGDLRLNFTLEKDALVYYYIPPNISFERGLLEGTISTDTPNLSGLRAIDPATLDICRQWTQIGTYCWVDVIKGWDSATNAPRHTVIRDFSISCTSMEISKCYAILSGYNYTEECHAELVDFFSNNPFLVMSQKISVATFSSSPTSAGISALTCQTAINLATQAAIFFPFSAKHLTVFPNIQYQGFQVTVGSQRYPETPISTVGPDFTEQQLQFRGFDPDAGYEPCLEFVDSMHRKRSRGDKMLRPISDCTLFFACVQFQQSMGPHSVNFNGVDSKGENWPVQVFGTPLAGNRTCYPPEEGNLFGLKTGDKTLPPPPRIVFLSIQFFDFFLDRRVSNVILYNTYGPAREFWANFA